MDYYTEMVKIIKELAMKYGIWKPAIAISIPLFVWKFADIINALAPFLK